MATPWDHPNPRGLAVVQALMRVIVAIQCWGAAAQGLGGQSPSDVARWLFLESSFRAAEILRFDRFVALGLLAAGLVSLVRPMWLALFAAAGWFAAEAAASLTRGGEPGAAFVALEHAVWIAAPISLAMLDWWPPKLKFTLGRFVFALGLLRWTAATSLAAQGAKQLWSLGERTRLEELVSRSLTAAHAADGTPEQIPLAMGALAGADIAIALLLAATRSRSVACLAGAWCLARIAMWTLAFGPEGYPETLVRAALPGAPLVLAAFAFIGTRVAPPEILPQPAPPK
ncbi:MAG: hypothetical protein KF774_08665 [Planctomyces sp.]|nr:hypothetical protein [Planctomyces sp.]